MVDVPGQFLAVHAAATHATASDDERWAWVMGTVVHDSIELDLNGLAERLLHAADPLSETEHWCGAFVAVRHDNRGTWVYHDAGATHKVFYRQLPAGGVTFGSDPLLLGYWGPLSHLKDPVIREFQESNWLRRRHTRQGDRTWFEGVFQLMPNHSLDVASGKAIRTFPRAPREEMSSQAVVAEVGERLQFVMSQWLNQRQAFIGLSAGWDSRIVLAACRKRLDRLNTYSTLIPGLSSDHPDVTIPQRMAEAMGFQHRLIHPSDQMPPGMETILDGTFDRWREGWILPRLGWFKEYDPSVLAITGVTSEVAKNFLENAPIRTAKQATRAVHFAEHPWMLAYYDRWLSEDAVVVRSLGYSPKDFMHWEQDACNVAGASIHAFNFVVDSVTPFSSHHILKTLLAAPPSTRDKHRSSLYRSLVEHMWPELLEFPINPTRRDQLLLWSKLIGVYWPYKFLHSRFKARPFRN